EMYMRGPFGIEHRFDGAEVIIAARTGEEAPEPLEVLVILRAVHAARVNVGTVVVDLPDFDQGVADRITLEIQNSPAEVRDGADGGSDGIVDDQQIVVGV